MRALAPENADRRTVFRLLDEAEEAGIPLDTQVYIYIHPLIYIHTHTHKFTPSPTDTHTHTHPLSPKQQTLTHPYT